MKYLDYIEKRKQGTSDFPIAFYHMESKCPRYQMVYHWHPEYELIRIIEGSFDLTLDGKLLELKKGDILLIQDGIPHGGIPHSCIYECIVFDVHMLIKNNTICTKFINSLLTHSIETERMMSCHSTDIDKCINFLFSTMAMKETGYEFTVIGALYEFLGLVMKYHLYTEYPSMQLVSANHVTQFKKVLDYIEHHYQEEISLNDMATIAGMNPKYFCRFFREMSQRTPTDYVNYYRIECACEQLSTQICSVTDVAFQCGFNDISYFIKTFKRYKGITPKQYLRKEFK